MSSSRPIHVLVVGGMERLEPFYREAPRGVHVDIISHDGTFLEERAEHADALVLVVTSVSHSAAKKVRDAAKSRGTPLVEAGGPSVSRVRASIAAAFVAVKDAQLKRAG